MARRPLDPALLETLRGILRQRGHRLAAVDPLPGDVSSRHYFRMLLETGGTVVLAVYPDELSAVCGRFSETAALLSSVGVRVPRILDADCDAGWMLVEDLGEQNLYQRFAGAADPWPDLSPYYRAALTFIDRIQRVPAEVIAGLSPPLDRGLLAWELEQTWEAFFEARGWLASPQLARDLRAALELLLDRLSAEELRPCHRDFMPRNLVPLDGAAAADEILGVLDHQDLRLGPPYYDLASLLNDSLFPPEPLVIELAGSRWKDDPARLCYHRVAAQRTLKAVGTYLRFGGEFHRPLIVPTFERALGHLARLPETAEVACKLDRQRQRRPDLLH